MKEYRQKNKSKLNDYHKKYYHSKKKKEGDKEEKIKEDNEEIKSIDLSNNNNENDHIDKDNENSDNDKNDNSDDDSLNEKEHYINVSYIIEEMKSLKDELEATRSLLENTNLLVEILNDELVKKHRHIKHLKKQFITDGNNEENENNENTQNEDNQNENNEEDENITKINYDGDNDNDYVPDLNEKDIMDIDFKANKDDFFANHEYKGLKLKNKGDEIKVVRMLKKYADEIRDKMNEKDKILSDHKKRIDDLEDENTKLLKKDLDKLKEEIKIKPKHSYPRSHREKNEDDIPTLIYY